ncbi:MAG: UbiX family flavin prenyltransferase [bacterium]|nr:UbiX family flavin prenyltransferase [Planctomycetota bacterium]HIL51459.1 UbiX family flavin prenyltransferase [Planctomycetota bacterium]
MSRYFIGLTGASGHLYGERLMRALAALGHDLDLALTPAGAKVLRHELGVDAGPEGAELEASLPRWLGEDTARRVRVFKSDEIEAPASSGTAGIAAVILCPCSMGTLARVSAGFSSNLVERAADVAIKERRPLLLVVRETPLSEIHLENLLRMARLGAQVLPAMPGFYQRPENLAELVDQLVGKILDGLGLEHELGKRWSGELAGDPGLEGCS